MEVTPWQRWEARGLISRHGRGAVVLLQTSLLCLSPGLSALPALREGETLCQRHRGIRDRDLTTLWSYWSWMPKAAPLINPIFQPALETAPAEGVCAQTLPGDLVLSPLWPRPRHTEGWELETPPAGAQRGETTALLLSLWR